MEGSYRKRGGMRKLLAKVKKQLLQARSSVFWGGWVTGGSYADYLSSVEEEITA